jgi:prepilin-type N-terminal cleavage/methylation domain-containing protein
MTRPHRQHRGFTLIEIMAVVSIIGVLASLAVTNHRAQLLRARKSERDQLMSLLAKTAKVHADEGGIRLAANGTGTFLADWNPVATPTGAPMVFDKRKTGWTSLDFGVEASIRFGLRIQSTRTSTQTVVVVQSRGDIDGDGRVATLSQTWLQDTNGWRMTAETVTGDDS